jgi:hypothetical protein
MAKKKQGRDATLVAVEKAEGAQVVMGPSGNVYRTSLSRLRSGAEYLPDPRMAQDQGFWGEQHWTGDEVRAAIIQLVSEGDSIKNALARLEVEHGRMPNHMTVQKWKSIFPEFKTGLAVARAMRGELAAEAAMEIALETDEDNYASNNVKIKALQWQASKLNPEDFGERVSKDVNVNLNGMSDDQLEQRLQALLSIKELRDSLPGQNVQDAEVVE